MRSHVLEHILVEIDPGSAKRHTLRRVVDILAVAVYIRGTGAG